MRRHHRVDANQAEIVLCLRKAGRRVVVMSHVGAGFPDLVVHWGGHCILMEVKMPGEKLTPDQVAFHAAWTGPPIAVVYGVRDALTATGIAL